MLFCPKNCSERFVQKREQSMNTAHILAHVGGEKRYDADGNLNPQGEYYRQVANVKEYYIGDLLIFTERF